MMHLTSMWLIDRRACSKTFVGVEWNIVCSLIGNGRKLERSFREKIGYFWLLRFGEKETMLEIDMGQNMMVSFYHMLICDILM